MEERALPSRHTMLSPRLLVRFEGIVFFAIATAVFFVGGGSWIFYFALILAPDLGMLGYLLNSQTGSYTYNALHTHTLPFALIVIGYIAQSEIAVQFSLIWIAHIGVDRAMGFGLKYGSVFKDTHLQKI